MFKVVKDSIKLNLPIPARSFYDIIFNNFMITYGQSCAPKGQLISKANCQAVDSSKKRTNEFVFTTMRRVFIHFLEEIEDTKKAFRN